MASRLEGKTGIVTGAAHGIGAAIALALAREGADIVAVDVCHDFQTVPYPMGTESELKALVQEIEGMGRKAIPVECDVTQQAEVESMTRTAIENLGRIDLLVNNAAVVTSAPVVELTEEAWELVMNVNLKGPFLCCKYVLPDMIARKSGKIVNIGSIDGRQAVPGFAHYSPSKAGLHMLTEVLSKEVSAYNINVNCVAPGAVWTPMCENYIRLAAPDKDPREGFKAMAMMLHEFGREVTPEDVANAVLFLVTEESRNLTGYTLYVDGGQKRHL